MTATAVAGLPRRGVVDTLKRGFDDAVANWPLILLRVGETAVYVAVSIIAAIAIIVPILVSVGLTLANIRTPDDIAMAAFALMEKWVLLLWILLGVSVLLLLFVAIHSFVQAGCARVYVDAERIAEPAADGPRARFKVFSMQKWLSGATSGWWTVFWIYNLAWGAAGVIFLIPLIPTIVLMLVFREQPPLLLGTGCIGLVVTMLLMIVVGVVTGMWTNRAIADWARERTSASIALSTGWQSVKRDLGRHLLITLAMIVIGMAGASFFASFSFFAAFGEAMNHSGMFNPVTMPIRLLASFGSWFWSAAVASWYLASYSSLSVEGKS